MRVTINGIGRDLDVPGHETLLTTLRERLALTGTKLVCGRGECGACTVHLDGEPVYACLTLAAACEGQHVTTIEGLAPEDALHPVQRAFIELDALQCGFCTPGQIMAAVGLLAEQPNPDEADVVHALAGNLCRCGAYPKIVRAVMAAAAAMRDGDAGGAHDGD